MYGVDIRPLRWNGCLNEAEGNSLLLVTLLVFSMNIFEHN